MKAITIEISGDPIPQPRARITVRNGFANAYTPKDHPIHSYRMAIVLAWRAAVNMQFDGPLRVTMHFQFARPKSSKRASHTVRPDVSNCIKGVEDALNGVAWGDDAQIVELCGSKSYGTPRTLITVEQIKEA